MNVSAQQYGLITRTEKLTEAVEVNCYSNK